MSSQDRRNSRWAAWMPVCLWMGVIYLLSDQPHSGEVTERYLGDMNVPIRKLAHMSEYAILFCLYRRALNSSTQRSSEDPSGEKILEKRSKPGLGNGAMALLLSVLYAASDEWHQASVPGRSATVSDALWDSAGACTGWAAWYVVSRIRTFSANSKTS